MFDRVKQPLECDNAPEGAPGVSNTAPVDIARLFREHNAALLRFTWAKLGSEQDAREVAQEAYVRLLQLDRPQAISFLRAFLFKTASNLAMDRLRARRRAPPAGAAVDEDLMVFDLSPERQIAGEQMLDVLTRALAELPAKCRTAFVLHRVEGLCRADIALRMGLQERMVRLYMARALEHLRRRLDEASLSSGAAP